MANRGPQNGQRDLERGLTRQLSQNKFFDPSTPSMRKSDDGEKKKKKKKEKKRKKENKDVF